MLFSYVYFVEGCSWNFLTENICFVVFIFLFAFTSAFVLLPDFRFSLSACNERRESVYQKSLKLEGQRRKTQAECWILRQKGKRTRESESRLQRNDKNMETYTHISLSMPMSIALSLSQIVSQVHDRRILFSSFFKGFLPYHLYFGTKKAKSTRESVDFCLFLAEEETEQTLIKHAHKST